MNKSTFSRVKSHALRNSLYANLELLRYYDALDIESLSEKARSLFYRNLIVHLSSIIEVLMIYLLIEKIKSFDEIKGLEQSFLHSSYHTVLLACKNIGRIKPGLYKDCDKVRRWRNSIHINVDKKQKSFAFSDVFFTMEVMNKVIRLI